MTTIEPTGDQLAAFAQAPIDGPIFMVNLLRFRQDGGAASYARYAEEVAPMLKQVGGRVVFHAGGRATVIGDDAWDQVLVVQYPSRDKFLEMIQSERYQSIAKYRADALLDSRLYCTQSGG